MPRDGGFEWYDENTEANFRKHGVHFDVAQAAVRDAFGVDEIDLSMNYGERRYTLIAQAAGKLVSVIYVERGDRVRIISARQATRREHDRYYRQNS